MSNLQSSNKRTRQWKVRQHFVLPFGQLWTKRNRLFWKTYGRWKNLNFKRSTSFEGCPNFLTAVRLFLFSKVIKLHREHSFLWEQSVPHIAKNLESWTFLGTIKLHPTSGFDRKTRNYAGNALFAKDNWFWIAQQKNQSFGLELVKKTFCFENH